MVNQAEGALDYPEGHLRFFVLALEQEYNVDQMVKDATHFLAERLGIE